ncbi:hypothetical protein AGMMS4956_05120 [Bacteroidia bacterium]|nr:hypothetical protein AGMMS4956_05120 [Bacteroidia bacterium]
MSKTFETAKTNYIEYTTSTTYTIGESGEVAGDYRYTLFKTCDVYVTVVFDAENKLIARYTTVLARPDGNVYGFDYSAHGAGFNKTGDGDLLTLTDDYIQYLSTLATTDIPIEDDPSLPPVSPPSSSIVLPLDVWGGKQSYSYQVLTVGNLSYTLVGGGAGGTGAAAARDYNEKSSDKNFTAADAGWSANGGPTVLKLNEIEIARANGGSKVDGPSQNVNGTQSSSNGVKGGNGQIKTGVHLVFAGDIITIEVGYGGGGSGGAAANHVGGITSSGNADKTLGSEGRNNYTENKTYAKASRGGLGAMHILIFPSSEYTSDIKKGSSSPAVSGVATAALGGQTKGEGSAAGLGHAAPGGMYASGGGGGAAGGFTLNGPSVSIEEK